MPRNKTEGTELGDLFSLHTSIIVQEPWIVTIHYKYVMHNLNIPT
jgi:hypothetical protein